MKKESLTAKQAQHAKPQETRIEIPAGPPKGLYLIVQPSGAKSWAFRYRWHGRPRKMTLKSYEDMKLAQARAAAEAALDDLDKDIDPAGEQQREQETVALKQESVSRVAEEFLKRALKAKEKERGETARILRRETKSWRTRDISGIGKPDVLRLLDEIVDRGASVMACRTRGVLLRFFEWAKNRGYIEQSPMLDVLKPGPDHKDRERTLDPAELAEVWSATDALGYPVGPFIRFLILTGQRRGEVATMRWVDVSLDRALWTIPGANTKNGRVHDVPLSAAALEILAGLPKFKGDCVWTTTSGEKPINGFSKSKERIDAETLKRRKERGIEKNIPGWTYHDIRRTCATLMAQECKIPPHILTRLLNHTSETDRETSKLLRKVYDRYQYLDEKRAALDAWAKYVVSLTAARKQATA